MRPTVFLAAFALWLPGATGRAATVPPAGDAEAPGAGLCVDRLRLSRHRLPREDARLYREREVLVSVDGVTPLRVTERAGGRLARGRLDEKGRLRWRVAYLDGTTYEADRFAPGEGPGWCLYYRPLYGHFERMELEHARANGRCLDCR